MRLVACIAAAICLLFTAPLFAQKVIFKDASKAPRDAELIESYGNYGLYRTLNKERGIDASYMDRLLIDAYTFDTQKDKVRSPNGFDMNQPSGKSLQLVQFVGPVKDQWLRALEDQGITPVHYVAQNGYLVWADQFGRDSLEGMVGDGANGLQFTSVYHSFFKVGPTLLDKLSKQNPGDLQVPVTVQMLRHANSLDTEQTIAGLGLQLTDWTPILDFQNARFTVRLDDLQAIANRPDVYWIGEVLPRELHDEVQAQIVAGNFNGDMSGPSGPGYLAYLDGLGFSQSPDGYPIVDVVDDGIGTGSVNSGDPTLHVEGDETNPTRLAYVNNCTNAANGGSIGGHGHINVSIAGGYDDTAGFPFTDPNGYLRGLGINPYGRMAGTRVFDSDGFDLSSCGGTYQGLIKNVQDAGAGIMTNSWGCSSCAGSYDDSSQVFDVGVRDADLTEEGNQELIVLFSAGNSGGSATVGTPGNGKNMITVGASENFRPSDEDGNWTDGCGIGPSGADDAMDVISFSSRGPAPGNRAKPEVIAPGTHIQGTASTNAGYSGSSVCDQYRPSGQSVFAASSGTSHSAPAIAGVASLAYYWIENQMGGILTDGPAAPPSPAMMKSYMIAHPTYLTGVGANDTLPSNSQGYGQPTLSLMFDDTLKYIHDQVTVFDNTGENWIWTGTVDDPTRPVRIVLAYTDQAGAIGVSPQVNDLNLTVVVDGNDTYLGNNFSGQWSVTGGSPDANNNYEAVFLPAGAASGITITVDAFNIAGDGVPNFGDGTDQDFAITCYNCVEEPTFTLSADESAASVCAPDDAIYDLAIGSILSFGEQVTLSTIGAPAGLTPGFSTNPVTPPGASTLTLSDTASGTPGSYTFDVQGISSPSNVTKSRELSLDLFDAPPLSPALTSPADGALNVATDVTLTWSVATQEQEYTVEVDDDPAFGSINFTTTVSGTSAAVPQGILNTSTTYYWRVRAANTCGSTESTVFDFTTVGAAGDCGPGSEAVFYFQDDMEGGVGDWTHNAPIGDDTWVLDNSNAYSPTMAWNATDVDFVTDQRLVSPEIVVPSGVSALTLQFWTRFDIEDRTAGGCYDGAILEYSTNGGSNWTQVDNAMLDTLPYTGEVQSGFSNPLTGLQGWCGEQAWIESVVDLSGLEGETLNFRFRLGTDSWIAAGLWHIDDVVVQSCETPAGNMPWGHGFEDPNP